MGNTQKELLEKYRQWLKIERGNSDSTIENSMAFLKIFLTWLDKQKKTIESIDQATIHQYLIHCHDHYSRNSLIPITINLRKFFIHFLGKDIIIKVPGPRAPSRDKSSLTQKEIEAILSAAEGNPLEMAIIKTLYCTGMRKFELIGLDISDVDFERLQITIRHGKGDRDRTINMTRSCAVAIQRWLNVRPKPKKEHEMALFLSGKRMRISGFFVSYLVKKIAAKAGITKNIYVHKFRITNVTMLAEAGLSPMEIKAQSGHKDIGTLVGYIQHSPNRIRKSYDRVFGENNHQDLNPIIHTQMTDTGEYKKMAIQKYLTGEIDNNTLHSILATLDEGKTKKKTVSDPSYF